MTTPIAIVMGNWSTTQTWELVGSILGGIAVALFGWFWLKRTRDASAFYIRVGITIPWVALTYLMLHQSIAASGTASWAFGVFTLIGSLAVLGVLWVPTILGLVGGWAGSLFDGGNMRVDPKPFYSIFRTKKMKGDYFGALAELRRQLDKFPNDFEGLMFLAELQAENLNDLPGAEVTVQRACSSPERPPAQVASALNRLADWHLSLTQDREAAQKDLEKIIELLPDTEMSLRASQRIGHLAETESLVSPHDRRRIVVKKGVQNVGLIRDQGVLKPREVNQEDVAAEYVKHLEQHPLDSHAREKLAIVYADHYHRLDLALDQLEQLVQQPNHPPKQVAHWLNLMTDLQVREGVELEEVRGTLQRIIDQYAGTVLAAAAQRRQDALKLEIKAQEHRQSVQMGTYEQNIGLRKRTV
jgi:tetratricopeptide (TPR) repeat protein